MNGKLKNGLVKAAAFGSSMYLMAPLALAQTATGTAAVDVTNVETKIMNQLPVIALIGGAVLLVIVAVKAFKWIRSALS